MSEAMQESGGQKRPGVTSACTACYQKKIRCDLASGKSSCSNCVLYSVECRPRLRKRRRVIGENRDDINVMQQSQTSPTVSTSFSPGSNQNHCQSSAEQSHTALAECLLGMARDETSMSTGRQNTDLQTHTVNMAREYDDPAEEDVQSTPMSLVHDGRALYFSAIEGRNQESTKAYPEGDGTSPSDIALLEASNAFDFPSRAIKTFLIDSFFKYCYPWVPVVERKWLESSSSEQPPSPLLVQAVLLAGSRVTSMGSVSSKDLYLKAKALFHSNQEKNPIVLIIACLLLQWWNPAGPERISLDSSVFWQRTGVGIATQIGLHRETSTQKNKTFRRRLWWSLAARDFQISAAHGRPKAIQTEESTVPPLTIEDFRQGDPHASCSVNYVSISEIFCRIGECHSRGLITDSMWLHFRNDLYFWIRELPSELRLFHQNPQQGLKEYGLLSRQLHIMYFVVLIILFRKPTMSNGPPPIETHSTSGLIVAASFIAGIFEELLIRDEILNLGPAIYKFFLLTAGVVLLEASKLRVLPDNDVAEDFDIIKRSLRRFADRYPSALATLHILEVLEQSQERQDVSVNTFRSERNVLPLFREFGPGLCRAWPLLEAGTKSHSTWAHTPNLGTGSMQLSSFAGNTAEVTESRNYIDDTMATLWSEMNDPLSWILDSSIFSG
ncbi:unnamed protein product [Clonostachys solani]|uniref:Zn(2)-C6 fungal-type domain-containing protein n=1 Tax=Clonostachys solani TaxID=160281 RepID=A0A9N9ZMT5_9HYPO|nr:unnamed protein product [Clonostachys solani]